MITDPARFRRCFLACSGRAAGLILFVGLVVAKFLPDAYYGPCFITTEFHCGYHPRIGLKLFIATVSICIAVLLWVAAPRADAN